MDIFHCVDVEAFGKVYQNANYPQHATVKESYLRWLDGFKVRPRKGRKASNHLRVDRPVSAATDSPANVQGSDRLSSLAPERIVIWSKASVEPDCIFCKAWATDSDILPFHASVEQEASPVEDPGLESILESLAAPTSPSKNAGSKNSSRSQKKSTAEGKHACKTISEDKLPANRAWREESQQLCNAASVTLLDDVALDADDAGVEGTPEATRAKGREETAEISRLDSAALGPNTESLREGHSQDLEATVRTLVDVVREQSIQIAALTRVVAEDHSDMVRFLESADRDRAQVQRLLESLVGRSSFGESDEPWESNQP